MRLICLWILGAIVVWPIHFTVANVGGRPVELVLSDFLFVLIPVAYLLLRSEPAGAQPTAVAPAALKPRLTPILALICLAYIVVVVGVGFAQSRETLRLYSALKLAKPIGFVFLGMILCARSNPVEVIGIFSRSYAVLVGLTCVFTLADPNFPTSQWGSKFFQFEISGYPNSAMTFFAVLVPLLLAAADSSRQRAQRFVGWGLAIFSALIVIGSMSRSSTLALFFSTGIYLALTGRWKHLAVSAVVFAVLSVIGLGLIDPGGKKAALSRSAVEERNLKYKEEYDPSNGRFEIWRFVLLMAREKPVFGYQFEPLSRYGGEVETPHQQYLEILYKCGGVGLLIYGALLLSCLNDTRRLLRLTHTGSVAWYQLYAIAGMMIGVLIGNMTQSNLTYSLTGNLVFLIFGCLNSARAVTAVSVPAEAA